MTVVLDTSSLNYLILIGAEEILPQLFGSIYIPNAVRDELNDPGAPDSVQYWMRAIPDWLYIAKVEAISTPMLGRLHPGEREVILLANEIGADLIVLDEQMARTIAMQNDLRVTGTLGLLHEGGTRGLIDVPKAVNRLRQTTFRAAPSLYKWLLDQHT